MDYKQNSDKTVTENQPVAGSSAANNSGQEAAAEQTTDGHGNNGNFIALIVDIRKHFINIFLQNEHFVFIFNYLRNISLNTIAISMSEL